jgi:hypothetical protein
MVGKKRREHFGTGILMVAVFGVVWMVSAKFRGEVANVMQQGGDNHVFRHVVLLGNRGAL